MLIREDVYQVVKSDLVNILSCQFYVKLELFKDLGANTLREGFIKIVSDYK